MRNVQVAGPGENARDAARRMITAGVGTLVVLGGDLRPAGFITDRDLAFHCVAEARDPAKTPLETIMAQPVVTVPEDLPIEQALARMADAGVRRLAVVDRAGALAGVLALDDVLALVSEEFAAVGRILGRVR